MAGALSRFARAALGFVSLLAAVEPAGSATLESRLAAVLGGASLRGASRAALVVDAADGGVVYALDAERALAPASNQKVLTAIAALDALGPAHRFTTRVLADRDPGTGEGEARGRVSTLYVIGGGDPALTSEEWWRLAADLRRAGLRQVTGDLVLDDGSFDRVRWHPDWGAASARAYHAAIGALSANYGSFGVAARAGAKPGDPVAVEVDPPVAYFEVVNQARTGSRGGGASLSVERQAAGERERVIVAGSLPAGSGPETVYRSVADPARYAGAVLRMQLEAVGIRVGGGVRLGPAPPEATSLLAFEGRSLAESVRLCLKYSNNGIAETLLKGLGARESRSPGSWANGVAALQSLLRGLSIPTEGASLVDGSGLATTNRVSPRTFVAALLAARRSFRIGPELESALPIAHQDGTLERRAERADGAVRAKTGLLNGVTGLSGYARTRGGRDLVFSVLVNGYTSGDLDAMAALDAFVAALVDDV
jgi:D-alanyl-D-alanine carboxypeptidase/D-alanyl-D-alanine-endopeptidase (penicillin-binding protein 4)